MESEGYDIKEEDLNGNETGESQQESSQQQQQPQPQRSGKGAGPALPEETEEYLRQVDLELKAIPEGLHLVRALAERGMIMSTLARCCTSPSRTFADSLNIRSLTPLWGNKWNLRWSLVGVFLSDFPVNYSRVVVVCEKLNFLPLHHSSVEKFW